MIKATQVVLLLNPQIKSVARFGAEPFSLAAVPENKWHETTSGGIASKIKNLSCPLILIVGWNLFG